jgi:hypothetical protein
MSVSEVVAAPKSTGRKRPTYSEGTLAAKVELEAASADCADAHDRWLRLEAEVRQFDDEHRGDSLSDDPTMMGQRARLRRLYSEAEVAKMRAQDRLREAGIRHRELAARDEYAFRASQMRAMYEARDAEDRARQEAPRRRRSLLGRLRR